MKMTRNFCLYFVGLLFLSALSFLGSCGGSGEAGQEEIVIDARFIHSRANVVYLDIIHVDRFERLDSLVLNEDGAFSYSKKTDKPLFIRLSTAEDNFITLIAEPGQTITLSGDINALAHTYTVSGSPASELVAAYLDFTRVQTSRLDTLALIWENNKYSDNKMMLRDSLDSLSKMIYSDQQQYVSGILDKNPSSLGSLFILYQFFGNRPVLDARKHFDKYEKLSNNLSKVYAGFEHAEHLKMKVNKTRLEMKEEEEIKQRLDTGKVAPDFSLSDMNDQPFSLSALKGRLVLLHFWASWSPVSMRQTDALRYYNQSYGPKGLTIVSVSFDYDRQMWTSAIDEKQMKWTNICDLKYTDSPIKRLYHIGQVPYYFLLDREGVIIGKSGNLDEVGNAIYRFYAGG